MVDIHSHILPGVDDGAASWEIAAEMCRMAADDGIQTMVATPHANHRFAYDRVRHEASLQQLRELIGGRLRLSLGCDLHASFENLQEAFTSPEKYLIGGTGYLLVELSDFSFSPAVLEALLRLISRRITPIITHPERNQLLLRQPEIVLKMVRSGCVIQVTASSFSGGWGEGPRKLAHWLLKRGALHAIASDAHDLKHRPPLLSPARAIIEKLYGNDIAEALTRDNPAAIVSDAPLPYCPPVHVTV